MIHNAAWMTIIPYQELLGNYDPIRKPSSRPAIIPYQELLGNYDHYSITAQDTVIIPYQELLGNYDDEDIMDAARHDYTIPRAIREL